MGRAVDGAGADVQRGEETEIAGSQDRQLPDALVDQMALPVIGPRQAEGVKAAATVTRATTAPGLVGRGCPRPAVSAPMACALGTMRTVERGPGP